MRTLRLLLVFLSSILLFLSFLYLSIASEPDSYSDLNESSEAQSSLKAFFSFRSPGSFFTPSATISLTDDNSTFFAARPAAFGPLVPSRGLSGEIWIGSGFGDDNLRRRGLAATVEGELGCDDIPGWADRDWHSHGRDRASGSREVQSIKSNAGATDFNSKLTKGDSEAESLANTRKPETPTAPAGGDGTDDSFHYPLPSTSVRKTTASQQKAKNKASGPGHADIQSIQESAEIQGKVVLLSRGGCGFSEKVKWAQRRGATAVIVGDNTRGGSLIRMYAHGDTSNITIPSLFTSHTTAHLLSSLVPPGFDLDATPANIDASTLNPNGDSLRKANLKDAGLGQEQGLKFGYSSDPAIPESSESKMGAGWLKYIFHSFNTDPESGHIGTKDRTRKPPRSGRVKWLKMEDYDEEQAWEASGKSTGAAAKKSPDAFVIGVHDWRDPDIVHHATSIDPTDMSSTPTSQSQPGQLSGLKSSNGKGRVITPGSGEYNSRQPSRVTAESVRKPAKIQEANRHQSLYETSDASDPSGEDVVNGKLAHSSKESTRGASNQEDTQRFGSPDHRDNDPPHEGLWVTLTLTSMNTNPFFHTLFVLVVSPLITLAVVYTMLLIRSRIRQRRWRAPKSVVEQLPVRVYQALSNRSTANNSSEGSPTQNACSSTTPLLVPPRSTDLNARPRSRTVCVTPGSVPSGTSANYGSLESHLTDQEKTGPSSWRKRYGGKQVECCVCLEEYVDGVSKVMSLPCGHDFHVECITPWLTTRRRTCPICKWDVVRSMSNRSTPEEPPLPPDGTEDVQARAAETVNRSPSATRPLPSPSSSFVIDIEQGGRASPTPDQEQGSSSWISRNVQRGLDSFGSLGNTATTDGENRDSRGRTPSPDRNR